MFQVEATRETRSIVLVRPNSMGTLSSPRREHQSTTQVLAYLFAISEPLIRTTGVFPRTTILTVKSPENGRRRFRTDPDQPEVAAVCLPVGGGGAE